VALVGDSYAVGLAPELRERAAASSVPFASHAVGGTSVCQWETDSWLGPALAAGPATVLCSLGGNDFGRTDPERVRGAILTFARKVRAAGARLVWIEPPLSALEDPNGIRAAWWNVVGSDGFRPSSPPPLAADGIHSTPEGYRAWARELWDFLLAGA
jgi:lysophospholipase L1-like esterase